MNYTSNATEHIFKYGGRDFTYIEYRPCKRLFKFAKYDVAHKAVFNLQLPYLQIWPLAKWAVACTCTLSPLEDASQLLLLPVPNQTEGIFCLGPGSSSLSERERVRRWWKSTYSFRFQDHHFYHTTFEKILLWETTGKLPLIRSINSETFFHNLLQYG
jgi:hypothetical protein